MTRRGYAVGTLLDSLTGLDDSGCPGRRRPQLGAPWPGRRRPQLGGWRPPCHRLRRPWHPDR